MSEIVSLPPPEKTRPRPSHWRPGTQLHSMWQREKLRRTSEDAWSD